MREEESAVEPAASRSVFHRVLLKLSGEALMGDQEFGLDLPRIEDIAEEIVECRETGVEIAVVVGAGNIYRGMSAAAEGMDRATADYAGMLATLLNALALQDVLERLGAHTRILSAIGVAEVAEGGPLGEKVVTDETGLCEEPFAEADLGERQITLRLGEPASGLRLRLFHAGPPPPRGLD